MFTQCRCLLLMQCVFYFPVDDVGNKSPLYVGCTTSEVYNQSLLFPLESMGVYTLVNFTSDSSTNTYLGYLFSYIDVFSKCVDWFPVMYRKICSHQHCNHKVWNCKIKLRYNAFNIHRSDSKWPAKSEDLYWWYQVRVWLNTLIELD